MSSISLLYFIPIGPNTNTDFLEDTIDSISYFENQKHNILLFLDGSLNHKIAKLQDSRDNIIIKTNSSNESYNTRGAFWARQSQVLRNACNEIDFSILIRLDDDSIIVGHDPSLQARTLFKKDPTIGLIGQYQTMPDGSAVNNRWPASETDKECQLRLYSKSPLKTILEGLWALSLRKLVKAAIKNGWKLGGHVTGGGYFITKSCLEHLARDGLLPPTHSQQSKLGDDHLLTLSVAALGYKIHDCSGTQGSVSYRLDRFPFPISELSNRSTKIAHSTKRYNAMNEGELRSKLRQLRQ